MSGHTFSRSRPRIGLDIAPCRARIQFTLPRSVLISPLCAMSRKGCARSHVGNLMGEQHPLVDDRSGRHRGNVELLPVRQLERLYRVPGRLADDVELAFERIG